MLRMIHLLVLTVSLHGVYYAQEPAARKKVLAIGESRGFQHDSVSHALAVVEQMGQESGLYDTFIRTDSELITKKPLDGNAKNLDYFDAVFFFTSGELRMDEEQKAALLAFVRDDGKGFLGMHSAADTFYSWPEYGELIGGYFDSHPWNTFEAPVIVEDRVFPATAHFPEEFTILDEIYQFKSFSRERVRVLMRLDESKIDLTNPNVRREDKDFAVAWVKTFGSGRVFYTTLGHLEAVMDRPDVRTMMLEAIKWTLRLTEGEAIAREKSR